MTQAPHRTPPEDAGSMMEPAQMLTRRLAGWPPPGSACTAPAGGTGTN